MTSRPTPRRTRKPPAERRREILETAARIGLTEGLECITLRRVAEELTVQPGLVSHYFPAVDQLVADAFAHATATELDALLPEEHATLDGDGPLRVLRALVELTASSQFDNISRLWINARHLARYRPVLLEQVIDQELAWCRRLESLIVEGCASGSFTCEDPWAAAARILVVIDGVSAYINTSAEHRRTATSAMVGTTVEAELSLTPGALAAGSDGREPTRREPT